MGLDTESDQRADGKPESDGKKDVADADHGGGSGLGVKNLADGGEAVFKAHQTNGSGRAVVHRQHGQRKPGARHVFYDLRRQIRGGLTGVTYSVAGKFCCSHGNSFQASV